MTRGLRQWVSGCALALAAGAALTSSSAGLAHGAGPAQSSAAGHDHGRDAETTSEVTPASTTIHRNAIVFLVDDMDDFSCADTRKFLPKSSKWLLRHGTCYENGTVTIPVCCPARAVLATGQLPHNNGVRRQIDGHKLRAADTVQHDLGLAGITTYGTGKFLNGVNASKYMDDHMPGTFDTGFDDTDFWSSTDYYNYNIIDDDGEQAAQPVRTHTTVRTGNNLNAFIKSMSDAGHPFYGYAAFKAPHTQNDNHDQYTRGWLPKPTPANAHRAVPPFQYTPEQDTSDKLDFKPDYFPKSFYKRFYQHRVRALYDIDDQMARTFELLKTEHLLGSTAVFFTSDNGFALNENGWLGKGVPYPSSLDVPMLAYVPGRAVAVSRSPVGLVDIAPTLYDYFDIAPGHRMDGHSLLGSYRRSDQYFEYTNEKSGLLLKESGMAPFRIPSWEEYRKGGQTYIRFYNKSGDLIQEEFYRDPGDLINLLDKRYHDRRPSKAVLRAFRKSLKRYSSCAGTVEQHSANPCP
jgi:N-acetylglucosamine-6-sulfatase